MAHRIVDETSLKTVADAIREKAGTSDSLVFPTGFAEAIAGIQAGGGSDEEWFNDGDTHIWITLPEGRTSPMLGIASTGTVYVDWGDGTAQDKLTGRTVSNVVWTPTHHYSKPGDYVITLTTTSKIFFNGKNDMSCLLRYSSTTDIRNRAYVNAIKKIEFGNRCIIFNSYMLEGCESLSKILLPDSMDNPTGAATPASLMYQAFLNCYSLQSISIPENVIFGNTNAFENCHALSSVHIPSSVTKIYGNTFLGCHSLKYVDFTKHSAVPELAATSAFNDTAADLEIRVPAALYDEWIAATNWSTYASNIVAV